MRSRWHNTSLIVDVGSRLNTVDSIVRIYDIKSSVVQSHLLGNTREDLRLRCSHRLVPNRVQLADQSEDGHIPRWVARFKLNEERGVAHQCHERRREHERNVGRGTTVGDVVDTLKVGRSRGNAE